MHLTLTRLYHLDGGLHGIMSAVDVHYNTLEREWRHNTPNISCIPMGTYSLEPFSGVKYQDTFALQGPTVSPWPSELPRSSCVIHAASYASDLQGCIAVGQSTSPRGRLNHSRDAVAELLSILNVTDGPHYLTICGEKG